MKQEKFNFNNPAIIRVSLIVLSFVLLLFAGINIYRFAISTTDENWFRQPPSRVIFTQNVPVINTTSIYNADFSFIKKGDLLVSINNQKTADLSTALKLLNFIPQDSVLQLSILRMDMNKTYEVSIERESIADSILTSTPSAAYVFSVLPGGASDRAGMKAGDLIVKIKGKDFSNIQEADRILRDNKAGATIVYDILRQNEPLKLYVKLSVFGLFFSNIVAFIAGLSFIITGLLFGLKRPEQKAVRLIAFSFVLLGTFLISALLGREPQSDFFTVIRQNVLPLTLLLGMSLLIISFWYFPREVESSLIPRWFFKLVYIAIVINLIGIVISNFRIVNIFEPTILTTILILVIMDAVILVRKKKYFSREHKSLNRLLKYVYLSSFVFIVLLLFVNQTSFNFAEGGYVFAPLLLIPLGYIYIAGRYALYGLDFRIRRNIQYTFVSTVWRMAFVIGLGAFMVWIAGFQFDIPNISISGSAIEILDREISPLKRTLIDRIIFITATIATIYVSWQIGKRVQKIIDRKFHQSKFDYRNSVNQLNEVRYENFQTDDLAAAILEKLVGLMSLKRAAIVVCDNKHLLSKHCIHIEQNVWDDFLSVHFGELSQLAARFNRPVPSDELNDALAQRCRSMGILLLIPVKSSQNKSLGMVLLGEKQSESPFHRDDFDFISAAFRQIAVGLENSLLYQDLAARERMSMELNIAREIQMSSLPQNLPQIKGLDIAGTSLPALEVGGDYFDYLNGNSSHDLTVIVGDVSGKGTSSALYMSKIQGILRSLYSFKLAPAELFVRANEVLSRDIQKKYFITSLAASFNTEKNTVSIARAGHLPLYQYNAAENCINSLTPAGVGFGLGNPAFFKTYIDQLDRSYDPGDIFVFVTDGITEAFDGEGMEYGEHRLLNSILVNKNKSAALICQALIDDVLQFAPKDQQYDDITIVVVKAL